jgi:surfactin synthase thioesterase subunit
MAHAGFITSLPYVVFGHSLGSRVAFELCNRLAKVQLPLPRFFIGSGSRAPHLASLKKPTYDLPDAEFMQELSELNGTPKEVLHNHELMQLLLPLLRADFKIADTYQAQAVQHPFPIWVFHGEQDVGITADQLQSWTELSSVECTFSYFPGDHFFVMEHSNRVVPQVVAVTQQVLSRLPAGDSVVMV